MRDNTGKSAQR